MRQDWSCVIAGLHRQQGGLLDQVWLRKAINVFWKNKVMLTEAKKALPLQVSLLVPADGAC